MSLKRIFFLMMLLILGLSSLRLVCAKPRQEQPKIWAAIGVNKPLFRAGEIREDKDLLLYFIVVNDGSSAINPKFDSSKLVVNGSEPADLNNGVFGSGLRSTYDSALPPGKSLEHVYGIGERFKKPGVYKIVWKGEEFETLPIVFRIMPSE